MDKTLVVALAAVAVAVAAAVARHHFIAIVAALAAGAAFILDRYGGFQQLPAGGETARMELHGRPVSWSKLYVNGAAASRPGNSSNVSTLSIMGANAGDQEIKFHELYFLRDRDGKKLAVQIGRAGARYKIQDAPSLPPGALFFVVSDPLGPTDQGLSVSEFLTAWTTISFVAKYNGMAQTIGFDRQTVELALPKP